MKRIEIDKACSMNEIEGAMHTILVGKIEKLRKSKDSSTDGMMILRREMEGNILD
jgi:hypothetical protein